ncbi:MAG: hypothetical protein RBR50_06445 [Candidatus Izemoplasmatales bacterium]|nr:hypothetical protein [Candidatus Izemoplasmatales bacterium]
MKFSEILKRSYLKVFYNSFFHYQVEYNNFNPKSEGNYIILSNYPSYDLAVYISLMLKKQPYIAVNEVYLYNENLRNKLGNFDKLIKLKDSKVDVTGVKKILSCLDENNSVLLFPEEKLSMFGVNTKISISIAKLIKKANKDVLIAKADGASLSMPNWGKRVFRGYIELNFEVILKKADLKNMSVEEISDMVSEHIVYDDNKWNEENLLWHKRNRSIKGIENHLYLCPKCKEHQTLSVKKSDIYCDNCGYVTSFNEFSVLTGLNFSSINDWGKLQINSIDKVKEKIVYTQGTMYMIESLSKDILSLKHADIELNGGYLFVQNNMKEYSFEIENINGLKLLSKNFLYLRYKKKEFLFELDDCLLIYDLLMNLKS